MPNFRPFIVMVVVLCTLSLSVIGANIQDPLMILKDMSSKVLLGLKNERPSKKTNSDEWIYRIIQREVLPYADVDGMSRAVLGRDVWSKASAAQQKSFVQTFTRTVVKTYSSALNAYTDETIQFFPIRGDYSQANSILIHSQVIRPDGPPVPLDYRLVRSNNQWKIFDLSVEGVSLLQSFHSQFSDTLSQGKTLDQLIHDLQTRNQTMSS